MMTRAKTVVMVVAALSGGCGEDPTAIDFELVSDPNVSTTAQLVDAIDSVLMIFDSPDGLYTSDEARSDGNVQVRNADADESDLELVALVPVPDGRLPLVRLERGGLPDVPIDLRVVGVRGPEEGPGVARGGVRGTHFAAGEVVAVTVPFNIRPELLPPRVLDVLPRDGDEIPGCDVPTLVVTFSKRMDPASLAMPGRVMIEPGGAPARVTVEPSGLAAMVVPQAIEPSGDGMTLSYRLTIAAEALDTGGMPLDQMPGDAGAQPFEAEFVLRCGPGMMIPDNPCETDTPGGPEGMCPGAGRLICVDAACVLNGCTNVICGDGFVCSEGTSACELDCRLHGGEACPVDRPACDETTGVCF
jgi:hypothetical protein